MKKIKNFEKFNEGLSHMMYHINQLLKRGGDFAQDVWDSTKRESQETTTIVYIIMSIQKY